MKDKPYKVEWSQYARISLAKMKLFKIAPEKVYKRSKLLLSRNPLGEAWDVADFPGFEFNGYKLGVDK